MPARFCVECGSPLPGGAKFCPQCGTKAAALANGGPADGGPADDGGDVAGFAREAAGVDAPSVVATPVAPAVPPELAAKYAEARAALRGDRREVVVLFADLSGYTALSETMDPEEVSLLMHRLLGELAAVVHKYEGYVDKYIGDAVMALFGAPIAHENDAERAVLAALEMLDAVQRKNQESGRDLAIRVGLNLGEVVAAQIGSEDRLQYTAMGDVVNVASRLEGRAETNTVLVSDTVHARIAERFETVEREAFELKGRKEPVRAYRVVRYRATGLRGRRPERTAFVGREAELARVVGLLEDVAAGRGGGLVVEAEAGSGKSRLVREALNRAGTGLRVMEAGFTPFPSPGSQSLEGELQGALGVEVPPPPAPVADPQAARRERWRTLAEALRRAAAEGPVLLHLDDVHWAEEASRELVGFLRPVAEEAGVGLLATSRPPAEPPFDALPRLALEPLGETEARDLLGERWEDLSPRMRKDLLRLSEGNPLYLEELARSLGEAGAGAEVPGTLQALIRSRVDRLPPPVQRLLQMAAVLGHRFPEGLLARMWALESQPVAFDDGIDALEGASFLDPAEGDGGDRRFHHALAQDVAYRGILKGVRRVLHESAARIGEEYYGEEARREAPFFALHWWEADQPERAAPWLWAAGADAAGAFDLATAEGWLERAVTSLARAPEALPDPETRAELHETAGTVFLQRGRLADAEARYEALEALAERESRPIWAARGIELRGRVAWYRGRLDEAIALFEDALERVGDDAGRIAADVHNDLGIALFYSGDEAGARARHERALEIREGPGDRVGMAKSLSNLGNLDVDLGDDLERAESLYRRALALAEEAGDRGMQASVLVNLGRVLQERGRWEEAIEGHARAIEVAEEIGWTFLRLVAQLNTAHCETCLGRLGSAIHRLEALARDGDRVLEAVNRVNLRAFAHEAFHRALDDVTAGDRVAEARRLAEELGTEEMMDEILVDEGRIHAARGEWAEAEAKFAEAVERAEALEHAIVALSARAHRARAAARAGMPEPPGEAPAYEGPRAPVAALLQFLAADARATRSPDAGAAAALEAVGEAAAALGDPGMERAAWERAAALRVGLGETEAAAAHRERARAAMRMIADSLPEELRERFLAHPRNAGLREGAEPPGVAV